MRWKIKYSNSNSIALLFSVHMRANTSDILTIQICQFCMDVNWLMCKSTFVTKKKKKKFVTKTRSLYYLYKVPCWLVLHKLVMMDVLTVLWTITVILGKKCSVNHPQNKFVTLAGIRSWKRKRGKRKKVMNRKIDRHTARDI